MALRMIVTLLCCFCFFDVALAQNGSDDMERVKNAGKRKELLLDKASEDISDNITLWVELRKEYGPGLDWTVSLGDKIPSQPVAVIEVLSRLDASDINGVCPRDFIEAEHYVMEHWMNKAIASLDLFTMTDPKKEAIRKQCLKRIQNSLANKDKWQ